MEQLNNNNNYSDPNKYIGVSSLVDGVNLGFGSLKTLEGYFGLLGRRTLGLVDVHAVYSVDVQGGPPDVCYFLEYPLVNT
jgi:hypothetical protein